MNWLKGFGAHPCDVSDGTSRSSGQVGPPISDTSISRPPPRIDGDLEIGVHEGIEPARRLERLERLGGVDPLDGRAQCRAELGQEVVAALPQVDDLLVLAVHPGASDRPRTRRKVLPSRRAARLW